MRYFALRRGRCFLTVTASGEMIPCGEFIGLKNSSGGNIFKTGIREAMESAPFQKIRSRFVEKIAECDVCLYRNICGAPCPAELGARVIVSRRRYSASFTRR